ncbi:hypothetical protein HRbin06_00407 [archaeon HR06]|nr:hypothetical protein HRbin06_00407 [archaeon HR06]
MGKKKEISELVFMKVEYESVGVKKRHDNKYVYEFKPKDEIAGLRLTNNGCEGIYIKRKMNGFTVNVGPI